MTKPKKILSFAVNLIRNINLVRLNSSITIVALKEKMLSEESLLARFRSTQSPSRNLSNHFWNEIDFEFISKALGGPINVLEIGCGTGRYSEIFKDNYSFQSYTGIDIASSSEWKVYQSHAVQFFQDTYLNTKEYLADKNLVFTQSALEHFENDSLLIKALDEYLKECDYPSIVIHLVPPSSALYSYLWHGLRQYPIRTINRILRKNHSDNYVVILGGFYTNRVHRKYITYPSLFKHKDLRNSLPTQYLSHLVTAVQNDAKKIIARRASSIAIIQVYNSSYKLDNDMFFKE
jgi:SAM-dependent methyltransferase